MPGLRPEYLLAYSCKGRSFCTSCHTRRAVAYAEWLHTTVLWPVAHRQIVLTIPKMPRAYFRYDRRLLGELCRVAAETLVASFHILLGEPGGAGERAFTRAILALADFRERALDPAGAGHGHESHGMACICALMAELGAVIASGVQ